MLHSICQQIWKTQQWSQDWKRSVFIPVPKKGNAKECSNYCTIALISHTSKVMLTILQVSFQQYVYLELPDDQARFRKGRGTRDQIAYIHWIIEKQEFEKNICFCFTDYAKAFTAWITTNSGKFCKRWEYQTTLPASWEICMQVKKQQLESDMGKKKKKNRTWRKGIHQGCILPPCFFNLYAEYIIRNARLDEAKLKSRLLGEISITSDMQMIPPL